MAARVCLRTVCDTQSSLLPNSVNARVTRPGSGLGGFLGNKAAPAGGAAAARANRHSTGLVSDCTHVCSKKGRLPWCHGCGDMNRSQLLPPTSHASIRAQLLCNIMTMLQPPIQQTVHCKTACHSSNGNAPSAHFLAPFLWLPPQLLPATEPALCDRMV